MTSSVGYEKVTSISNKYNITEEMTSYLSENSIKICLTKSNPIFFIQGSMSSKNNKASRGYLEPVLTFSHIHNEVEKIDITISAIYKEVKVDYTLESLKFFDYYFPPRLALLSSSDTYVIPSASEYWSYSYKPIICQGDSITTKIINTNTGHNKASISHFELTYLPREIVSYDLSLDEGGCSPEESSSTFENSGVKCLKIYSFVDEYRIYLEYELGIAKSLIIKQYYPHTKELSIGFKISLTRYDIGVKRVRAVSNSKLFFIESSEYSTGYIIAFSHVQSNLFKIRKLEGISTDNFIERKGIFLRQLSGNTIIFNYYSLFSKTSKILDYSVIIKLEHCIFSFKSKITKNVSEKAALVGSFFRSQDQEINLVLENNKIKMSSEIEAIKKLKVKNMGELEEFELDFYEYFKVIGHGIVVDYPLRSDLRYSYQFELKVDQEINGYSYSSFLMPEKKLLFKVLKPDLNLNLTFLFTQDNNEKKTGIITIFENYSILKSIEGVFENDFNDILVDICKGKNLENDYSIMMMIKSETSLKHDRVVFWRNSQKSNKIWIYYNFNIVNFEKVFEFSVITFQSIGGRITILKCDFMNNCPLTNYPIFPNYNYMLSTTGHYDENLGDYFIIYRFTEKNSFTVNAFKVGSTITSEFEEIGLEFIDLQKAVIDDLDYPVYFRTSVNREEGRLELILDGSDLFLKIITAKISIISQSVKSIQFFDIKIERYSKPTVLNNQVVTLTKDFVILLAVTTPLRRFTKYKFQTLTSMIIYERRSSKDIEDLGYFYRAQQIKDQGTTNNIIVENYRDNVISYLDMNYISTVILSNSIKILKRKISGFEFNNYEDHYLEFRGNFWSASDRVVKAEEYIEIVKVKEDKRNEKEIYNFLFYIGLIFLFNPCDGIWLYYNENNIDI